MTDDPDDDAFEVWLRSAPVQKLLRALWKAVDTARGTNEPRKRDAARTAVGAAAGAFLEGAGAIEQLQQQMVEHLLGETAGAEEFDGKTFAELTRSEMLKTRGGLAVMRELAARGILTLFSLMGVTFSATAVAELRGGDSGREGIFAFTPKARVAKDSGPAHTLQEVTVARLGYTVGAKASQLNRLTLARGAEHYKTRAAEFGVAPVRRTTVRDWCQRAHAKVYQNAHRDGAEDRRNRCVNPDLIL